MAILNPTVLRWTDPTTRTDGSPFGAADFVAYELGSSPDGSNVTALLSLPTAFGVGQSPIPSAVSDVRNTISFLHLRTVAVGGQVSDWTPGVEVLFAARPLAPTAFSAE